MLKRKLSTLILAATITNLLSTPVNVFAETLKQNDTIQVMERWKKLKVRKLL